jgi:UDP-3-O-[3-hydroxymyristoyl] N-acetylglucosamine deacetylase/3-hydroxyacyl-[acyl-carrier-protein] dehydratase
MSKIQISAPSYDPNKIPVMDIMQIEQILPHRYPFLMVDKIVEMTDEYVIGIKNVTYNEPFFQGHFPDNPVMPGVLQLEAMGQCGGILCLSILDPTATWDTYFVKLEHARFKAMVRPGDTMIMKMVLNGPIKRGLCDMTGVIYVGDKLVCEAAMMAQVIKKS